MKQVQERQTKKCTWPVFRKFVCERAGMTSQACWSWPIRAEWSFYFGGEGLKRQWVQTEGGYRRCSTLWEKQCFFRTFNVISKMWLVSWWSSDRGEWANRYLSLILKDHRVFEWCKCGNSWAVSGLVVSSGHFYFEKMIVINRWQYYSLTSSPNPVLERH